MARKEGKFATHFVLHALLGHALIKRLVVVVEHFQIVLTATGLASVGSHSDFRLDLTDPNDDAFELD